ncbi:MAG: SHOCT domain-containing protein [Anaerolinea sp.]|nr:SHOCT domain-containing protein [Anaerolinea sp.]
MMTGFGMGFGSAIWMIIFWVIIIGGGIWLLAAIFPRISTSTSAEGRTELKDDPLAILKNRYARGELSKEEFETIRHDLEQA